MCQDTHIHAAYVRIHRHRRTHTSTVVKHMNECTHMRARHARTHTGARTHTHSLKCIAYNVNLSVRREAVWRYIIIHPVCLVFFFEKKKGRKNKSVHKIWHKFASFFSLFFLSFSFTVVSGQPLRSYIPCNQFNKRGQQNAYTHWSATACDVIRHPKTTLARWSILPTKLICLMCRCVLCQQYSILFWPEVSFFFLHSLSICLSVLFFQANFSWVFFFLVFDNWWPSAFILEAFYIKV